MPHPIAFQIYLLARMPAHDRVRTTCANLGITPAQMALIARQLAARHGLDAAVCPAASYATLLGPPRDEQPIAAPGSALHGSIRRSYELSLWPSLRFVVDVHPDGWTWGQSFVGPERPLPADPDQIEPWQWSREALLRAASGVRPMVAWSDYFEAELAVGEGGGVRAFRARFDLGLLQQWEARDGGRFAFEKTAPGSSPPCPERR
jgi:hypothetical protein